MLGSTTNRIVPNSHYLKSHGINSRGRKKKTQCSSCLKQVSMDPSVVLQDGTGPSRPGIGVSRPFSSTCLLQTQGLIGGQVVPSQGRERSPKVPGYRAAGPYPLSSPPATPTKNSQIQLRVKFYHFLCGTQRFYVMTSEWISSLLKSPIFI